MAAGQRGHRARPRGEARGLGLALLRRHTHTRHSWAGAHHMVAHRQPGSAEVETRLARALHHSMHTAEGRGGHGVGLGNRGQQGGVRASEDTAPTHLMVPHRALR
jgi:hypothetical protein